MNREMVPPRPTDDELPETLRVCASVLSIEGQQGWMRDLLIRAADEIEHRRGEALRAGRRRWGWR